jgi:hypothetical protein
LAVEAFVVETEEMPKQMSSVTQQMFAQEHHIRSVLSRLRLVVLNEQERYHVYRHKSTAVTKVVEDWKGRISVYTETSNLLADYLTDYTIQQHGVLKFLKQAEEEVKTTKATLLYLNQLHEVRTNQKAILLADRIAYQVMGEQVKLVEPQLKGLWNEESEKEHAIRTQIAIEKEKCHG